ncbi:AI-2E family transporter [Sedimentitalea sp. JM2-8]|uniref:AI-2E family transporter n=1 Tax=Sedimentitalea xiamensis TaxID=3050037 RepID=A0ABT7FDL3_9RHOB|nr:AI-2E family transporter [Sedimentitalea xiamensis]MDK3072914.1 AI-2E family transporter [Sedimentitalea xiamensis]
MSSESQDPGETTKVPESGTEPIIRMAAISITVALCVALLTIGAGFLVPIAEALIVWFILNRFALQLRRSPVIGPMLGNGTSIALAAVLITLIGLVGVYSGVRSFLNAGSQAMSLQTSMDPVIHFIARVLGTETSLVVDYVFDRIGFETLFQKLALGLLGLINQFGVVAIYVAFLVVDQAFFDAKMRALYPDPQTRAHAKAFLADISRQISSYLWIMTRVSLMTTVLSFVVMLGVGLDSPDFWAILIFVLNFIPTIGSILGTILPTFFALVQFDSLGPVIILLAGIGSVQFVIGNFVFPKMAGETLNMSLFVTIFSLFFWGSIWGITGMFLAVPLTAILVIVLSRFRISRQVAIMLSKNGQVGTPNPEPIAPETRKT